MTDELAFWINGEKVICKRNDVGTTGYSQAKKWSENPISHHIQNELKMTYGPNIKN